MRPEDYDLWLDADVRRPELRLPSLLPYPSDVMSTYAVSLMVNSPSNDSARRVEPIAGAQGKISTVRGALRRLLPYTPVPGPH